MTALGRKHVHREPATDVESRRTANAGVLVLAFIGLVVGIGCYGALWSGALSWLRDAVEALEVQL